MNWKFSTFVFRHDDKSHKLFSSLFLFTILPTLEKHRPSSDASVWKVCAGEESEIHRFLIFIDGILIDRAATEDSIPIATLL